MNRTLRILHLEDDPADAELIAAALRADGLACECTQAQSRAEFVAAMEQPWDLILADYALPGFDGISAQHIARARRPDVPFVFVSGSIGEEIAVERLKAGAVDYVLKQRLNRLPSAVRRALEEAGDRRARRALEQAVEFLQHLIAASPSMIFRFDAAAQRATFVSPNVTSLLGYAPEEMLEVPGFWLGLVHPDDRARVENRLETAIRDGITQLQEEYRVRHKDGRYRWFFTLLRVDYDASARPLSVLGYALDITDRKAAEEDLARVNAFLDSVIEHLPAMLFVKDARDLRYVRLNQAGERVLGLNRGDVIGRSDADVYPPPIAERLRSMDRTVLSGRSVVETAEEIVATRERGPRVMHTKKIPICDENGSPVYLLGISEDITDQKMAQEAARLSKLEAERASRAKSEFLSRMSHDLRTPLNAILGFAELLGMDALPGEQAESVRHIQQAGGHLLDMINEVLDIARIEAGHLALVFEPVTVEAVVLESMDLVRPLSASRGIRMTAELQPPPLCVHADRRRVKQILVNLLSNAVKYNRAHGSITVSARRADGRVRLSVTDTGAGIPADQLPRLFQPFERLSADRTSIEGTGLGLAVSKGLVLAMGGTIGVESAPGVGSTFWIDLGEAAVAEAPSVSTPAVRGDAAGADAAGTILYVEDNGSNVRLMERLLGRRDGIRLLTTDTGAAALDLVAHDRPDLILLDLHLPDMPGEEVLHALQADAGTREIPIVILTADATSDHTDRLLAAGARAYLTKPLQLARLLQLFDAWLPPPDAAGASATRARGES